MKELGRELVEEFFSLDRGLPYTFARLFVDPGGTMRRYVDARDPRITKPVRYFLVASAALAATLYALQELLERIALIEGEGRTMAVSKLALENLLPINAAAYLIGGLVLWLVFRRRRPTLVESVVVSAYVGAQTMWINAAFALMLLPGPQVVVPVAVAGGLLMFAYTVRAWGAYFGGRLRDYLLGFAAILLTQLVLGIVAIGVMRIAGLES